MSQDHIPQLAETLFGPRDETPIPHPHEIRVPDELIRPEVQLTGEDGNAFNLIGLMRNALRDEGNPKTVLDRFTKEAMNGDYNHLLRTCMAYADVS